MVVKTMLFLLHSKDGNGRNSPRSFAFVTIEIERKRSFLMEVMELRKLVNNAY